MKDKIGTYPYFEHFVEFLRSISNQAIDPVYGYDQIGIRLKKEPTVLQTFLNAIICAHLLI